MAKYWANRPQAPSGTMLNHANDTDSDEDDLDREFARYHQTLVSPAGNAEGWAAELQRYLNDMPTDVNREMDLVEYWQVWSLMILTTKFEHASGQPPSLPDTWTNRVGCSSLSGIIGAV